MSAEGVTLTAAEREALRTSGSWPNVGTDLFVAVERIVAARFGRVRELADEWERSGRPRIGATEAAAELRAAIGKGAR